MGEEQFLEWVERLFPGDSIEQATWKEIHELYEAKFRVIQGEDRAEQARHDALTRGPQQETTEVVMVEDETEIPFGYRVPRL
jgi:hypothetical protein